ncbi:MAG: hypothetical protein ACE5NP_01580 [Anaerolineae bacterium]
MPSKPVMAIISARLYGQDGVSIEARKWEQAFRQLGYEPFLIAGKMPEIETPHMVIPLMSLEHPEVLAIDELAFEVELDGEGQHALLERIDALAQEIKSQLRQTLVEQGVLAMNIENALAVPMNLPLGVALHELILEDGVPTVARHHDFYWERERFLNSNVASLLQMTFPPDIPWMAHVTINNRAQQALKQRRGIEARWFANFFDFSSIQAFDGYNEDLRQTLGLGSGDLFFLQPTRIVERKCIERSIELIARLREEYGLHGPLVITGPAENGGDWYCREVVQPAAQRHGVTLIRADSYFDSKREIVDRKKLYAIGDAYVHADLVTFPSDFEGFGNPVIEAAMYRVPLFVNCYPVLKDLQRLVDKPFKFITIDGVVTHEAVAEVYHILTDPSARRTMVNHNFRVAKEHFSMEMLTRRLESLLESLGLPCQGLRAGQPPLGE